MCKECKRKKLEINVLKNKLKDAEVLLSIYGISVD